MTKQELKAKIDKLENGIKSKATPSNLIAPLKAQKAKFEKELEQMESAEKKAVKTKKVSKVAEKIKAAKKSVAKKTPAKAPAKEERKKDNIARDGDRKSLRSGKRISKSGKVYYETRANRSDKQTSKKPYLAEGGETDGWRKTRTRKLKTREEAEKAIGRFSELMGRAGRNYKVEKMDDGYIISYESNYEPKMADGGKLPNGKYKYEKGDEGMFQGDEVRVVKYHNGDRTYEYNIIDEDGKVKTHGVSKAEKFENQFRYFPKMEVGGFLLGAAVGAVATNLLSKKAESKPSESKELTWKEKFRENVDGEGFDSAVTEYSEEIKDKRFNDLKTDYLVKSKALKKYIGSKEIIDEEYDISVKDAIDSEGFDYAFEGFNDWKGVDDNKFQNLYEDYKNSRKSLSKYVGLGKNYDDGGEIDWGADLGGGFSIGNDVYITDSKSLFQGKTGFVSGAVGRDLLVTLMDNGNERSVVVSKRGVQKLDAPEYADGGEIEETKEWKKQMIKNNKETIEYLKNKLERAQKIGQSENDIKTIKENIDFHTQIVREYEKELNELKNKDMNYAKGGDVKKHKVVTSKESYANDLLKYADLQNIPASSKMLGNKFIVTFDAIPKAMDSMTQDVKDLVNKMDKGGYMADGGMMDVVNSEISTIRRNIMGTTSFMMKIKGMRNPQDFSVYPISADQAGQPIMIQSATRIGFLDLSSGKGLMSQSHANGAYRHHFTMDKKVPFKISETDLQRLKEHISGTAGSSVDNMGISSDNSGASMMADGGMFEAPITKYWNTIKDFYINTYPTDDLGQEINGGATFDGLNRVLDCNIDVYEYIGVGDSIVRERLFEKLAELEGVNYDVIYNKWLASDYAKGGYMADGGKTKEKLAEYLVTLTDEDGYEDDLVVMAKNEDDAVYKAEQIKGYESSENGVVMLTDFDGNKIEYKKGGYMADGGQVKVGDILTAKTGVKVKVVEYDPKFGGRVRVERIDEYATGKPSVFMPLSRFIMADGGYMANGGQVPAHFGSGKNINVFGYQTENFDICATAVKEFESAIQIMDNGKETYKESLAKCAKYIDNLFGIEKYVVENEDADDANFYEAISSIMSASIYNYRAEMSINLFSFVPQHLKEIAIRMGKAEKGGFYALGGMTAGRWYKDKSGEEFKFIGKVDSGANKGRFLFSDGQKSVYKDLEEFEGGKPKETKLFGFFAEGGSVAEGNYEMLMSNIKAIKHHAEELAGAVKPDTEIEAWVLSKSERAETDLSDITHYLDGLKMEKGGYMADGGVLEGLSADIYRSQYDSPTNKLYGKKGVIIVDKEVPKIFDADESTPAVKLVRRKLPWGDYIHAIPYDQPEGRGMFGGTFIYSSDSRFPSKYPIPLHDRVEMEKGGYMAKGGDLTSIKEEYLKNEDENAHSENVVLLAKHFGTKEDLAKAKEILALHEKEGSLSSENGKKRQELHLKLIKKATKEMAKEGIEFEKGGKIVGSTIYYEPQKNLGGKSVQSDDDIRGNYKAMDAVLDKKLGDSYLGSNFYINDGYGKILLNDEKSKSEVKSILEMFDFEDVTSKYTKEKGGYMAKGGEVRYKLSGNNFGQQIESGKKFAELIKKAYENQTSEHKYPENFIKEIAYTGKIVKNDGTYFLKDYSYKGVLDRFEFLGDKYFLESLKYLNRPTIKNFKFEDGGMMAKGGEVAFDNSNLYLNGFGMDSNGNSVVKVSFPNQRAFSIQTNGVLNETNSLYTKKIGELTEAEIKTIEKEVVEYVKQFGSKEQKQRLKTYSGYMAKGGGVEKFNKGDKFYDTQEQRLVEIKNVRKDGVIEFHSITEDNDFYLSNSLLKKGLNSGVWFKISDELGMASKVEKFNKGDKFYDTQEQRLVEIKNVRKDGVIEFHSITEDNDFYLSNSLLKKGLNSGVWFKILDELGMGLKAKGGYMAKGGFVSKGELVWKKLTNAKKMEFLKENFTPEITPRSQETLVGKDYNFLPKNVKIKFEAKYANVEDYAMGGKTKFADKVKSVQESLLKRKKVAPKVQKDYGKTYSKAEAKESAQRIVGSRMAQLKEKMAKNKMEKGGKISEQPKFILLQELEDKARSSSYKAKNYEKWNETIGNNYRNRWNKMILKLRGWNDTEGSKSLANTKKEWIDYTKERGLVWDYNFGDVLA